MKEEILRLVNSRRGHFLLESGHHGDWWLELEQLCQRPAELRPFVRELSVRMARFDLDLICGPLVEGAFIGLLVAQELGLPFAYTERFRRETGDRLFPVGYRLPDAIRTTVKGKRVGILNDVINAGSAVRGTFEELVEAGGSVVAIGSMLVLGKAAGEFARANGVELVSLGELENQLWLPEECPLCKGGVRLEDLGNYSAGRRPER